MTQPKLKVAVTGATGFIGAPLCRALIQAGHEAIKVVRTSPRSNEIGWSPAEGKIDSAAFEGLDAVIHLAGAPIGGRRWNQAYRKLLADSRTQGTTLIAKTLAEANNGPKRLLSASAIGYYGDRPDEVLDESSPMGSGFLPELVRDWENSTKGATDAGVATAHLRTGIVLHPKGGALQKLLPLFRVGLGGKFGSGAQVMSWITLDDEISAITHLLTSELTGPVNLTAPNPVSNAEFSKTLGRVLKRPSIVAVPSFGPKLLLGEDMAQALLFDNATILPKALGSDGFSFAYPEIEMGLRKILNK